MLDKNALMSDPYWSQFMPKDTWAKYEKPLDMSEWPIEWIKQVPRDVRQGKEHPGIESIMLTK